jgi:hypothetical protein
MTPWASPAASARTSPAATFASSVRPSASSASAVTRGLSLVQDCFAPRTLSCAAGALASSPCSRPRSGSSRTRVPISDQGVTGGYRQILVGRRWFGGRSEHHRKSSRAVTQITSAGVKPMIGCHYGSIGGGDHATHQNGGCDWGGSCRDQRNRYRRCALLARAGQSGHSSHHGGGSEDRVSHR